MTGGGGSSTPGTTTTGVPGVARGEPAEPESLACGIDWEADPDPNRIAQAGRTTRAWVRSVDLPRERAMVKFVRTTGPELYSLGMERVAYVLGTRLGVPIPATYLEEFHGKPAVIQWRIMNSRSWLQAGCSPMLMGKIRDRDVWGLGVVFDIWLANQDRVPRNILIEARPHNKGTAYAREALTWLIDNGCTALWFPSKFDTALVGGRAADVVVGDGSMRTEVEESSRKVMPADYRNAYLARDAANREALLDRVRAVADNQIEESVAEIPDAYMTDSERDNTANLLKKRRDRIGELVVAPW